MLLESIPKGPIPTSRLSALSFLLLPTKIVLHTAIFEIMRLSPSVLPLSSCNSKLLWLPWRRPPRQPPLPRVVMNSWNPVQRTKALEPITDQAMGLAAWNAVWDEQRIQKTRFFFEGTNLRLKKPANIRIQILSSHFEENRTQQKHHANLSTFFYIQWKGQNCHELITLTAFLGVCIHGISWDRWSCPKSFLKDQDDMSACATGGIPRVRSAKPLDGFGWFHWWLSNVWPFFELRMVLEFFPPGVFNW